jgi:hypothetical protein
MAMVRASNAILYFTAAIVLLPLLALVRLVCNLGR